MTPDRWRKVRRIFDAALDQPAADRAAYLQRACGDDADLAAEVAALLTAHAEEPCSDLATFAQVGLPVSPGADATLVGQRVGPYRIVAFLAAGGMGAVYRAVRCEGYLQEVAIKVLQSGGDPGQATRFQRECQALADLRDPDIARLLDAGQLPDGRPYLVMEFLDGRPLDRYCDERSLTLRQRLELVVSVCRIIDRAHGKGFLHRDLKPSNLLVMADGTAKVIDFGLARRLLDEDGPTRTGAILGTPGYLAPEQANGQPLTPATDVYALGCVLYALLTGRPPYRADTPLATIVQMREEEPQPPSRLHPRLPRDVEVICLKCLHREPARRYASAAALADDLGRHLSGQPIHARPVPWWERTRAWMRRRPAAAALWAVSALALVALVVGLLWHERSLRHERASSLVAALRTADTRTVPALVAQLEPYRAWADPMLREQLRAADPDSTAALHLALALLPVEPELAAELTPRLLRAPPGEFAVVRDALVPVAARVEGALWQTLTDAKAETDARLRAASALASYAPADERWPRLGTDLAGWLVRENPLRAGLWAESLRPVQATFAAPLDAIARAADRPENERLAAVLLRVATDEEPHRVLAGLLGDTDLRLPLSLLHEHRARLVGILRAILAEPEPAPGERLRWARRQASTAALLVQLGDAAAVWPLLRRGADPSRRSYLIPQFAAQSVPPGDLFAGLRTEPDAGARAALVLALGEYRAGEFGMHDDLLAWLRATYRSDADAGLHGACEWLLRRLGRDVELRPLATQLASAGPPPGRGWYVSSKRLLTFSVVQQDASSFALATKEVTAGEFSRITIHRDIPIRPALFKLPADSPAVAVSWYDAAQFCRLLSEEEGIADADMCYPEVGDIEKCKQNQTPVPVPADFLKRTGYRLPTEAEWEAAYRAGTTTTWPHGEAAELLPRYANFGQAMTSGPRDGGRFLPNDLGLFDMGGNAAEWCHDAYAGDEAKRVLRGGAWWMLANQCRATFRLPWAASESTPHLGFRVARTLPER